MANHRILIEDGSRQNDKITAAISDLRLAPFLVRKSIFKRGRTWNEGETINLHPDTGAAFVARGELEPTENDDE